MKKKEKNNGSDHHMTKKTYKKFAGTILASVLLHTFGTVEAHITKISHTSKVIGKQEPPKQSVKALSQGLPTAFRFATDQVINPEQIQGEVHLILNEYIIENQRMGPTSMSLRGFYGNGIFSCRGLA